MAAPTTHAARVQGSRRAVACRAVCGPVALSYTVHVVRSHEMRATKRTRRRKRSFALLAWRQMLGTPKAAIATPAVTDAAAPAGTSSTSRRPKESRKASMAEITAHADPAKLTHDMAKAFFDADLSGDGQLSYDEFVTVVPTAMKARSSDEDLRRIFDSVDYDGSGLVSIDEFFMWTLSFMRTTKGSGLDEVFMKYDKEGKGDLTALEFARACEDVGYGDIAYDIFIEFDPRNKGTVCAGEVLERIKAGRISRNAKRFVTELAFDADRQGIAINSSQWDLDVECKEALSARLLYHMREHDPPARVSDLFRALADERETLSKEEFATALTHLGLPPSSRWIAEAAFKQMDVNGTLFCGESELTAWINGVEIRKAKASRLTFSSESTNMKELEWSPVILREQLQRALIDANLTPLDMLRALQAAKYGPSADDVRARSLPHKEHKGLLSKRQILVFMKKLVDDVPLWDEVVRDVVEETFLALSAGEKIVDVGEVQKFLFGGWMDVKRALQAGGAEVAQRKLPAEVLLRSNSAPIYGDPRWPNRVWPARRGDSRYAKRLLYRPSPVLKNQGRPQPALMPATRHTVNSLRVRHYITSPDAKELRRRLLHDEPLANRLTHCYFQAHMPASDARHRLSAPSLPYAGVSMSSDRSIYKAGALPHAGASRTSIATFYLPNRPRWPKAEICH